MTQARNGEITTMAQLLDDLKAVEADALNELENARKSADDAVAELDDAQGDATRAKEDAQRVELMVVTARQFLPANDDTTRALVALADTNGARTQLAAGRAGLAEQAKNVAEDRAAAAESRAAAAVTAHKGIESRHSGVREAVHAANAEGGAADKRFHVA